MQVHPAREPVEPRLKWDSESASTLSFISKPASFYCDNDHNDDDDNNNDDDEEEEEEEAEEEEEEELSNNGS
ncbi:hypothetical protein M0802_000443 [Mischocyttarus mexicanus]|nr:hypothetical protein M0802_000443 [Mischocyttarus mexicanus]